MQLWPAWEKAWILALSAAVSQSPSAWTISGAFEPSSRLTFLCGTLAADAPADPGRAGEGDRAGQLVLDDRVADLRAGAGDDAEPALRQPRLDQDLGQLQRRDRRLPGGLEDDRVAGGDRRPELVGDEVEREVEGADRADDAVGDAQHHAELAGARRGGLHRHRAAGQLARLDRGEGQRVDAALGLDRRRLQRLAGLGGDRQRQVLDSRSPTSSAARSSIAARSCWGKSAGLEGLVRGLDGPVDQRRVALRRPGRPRCRRRGSSPRPTRRSRSTRRRRELVVDRLDRLRRHRPLLRRFFSSLDAGRGRSRRNLSGRRYLLFRVDASGDPTILLAVLACLRAPAPPAAVGQGLGRQGPRLRPRGRHEPVRRLRLRQARLKDYRLSSPTTTRGPRSGRPRDADRPRPASTSSAATSASAAPAPAASASNPARATWPTGGGGRRAALRADGRSRAAGRQCAPPGRRTIVVGGKGTYRGALEVRSRPAALDAINAVALEQYVKGVVPNESPASWPHRGAQGAGGRRALLRAHDQRRGNGFDLYDDTRSQVYGGVGARPRRPTRPSTRPGCRSSSTAARSPQTFFSACSGGHTESIENASLGFGQPPIPYLRASPTPTTTPARRTTLDAEIHAGRMISAQALGPRGKLEQVVVTKRGVSPRIVAREADRHRRHDAGHGDAARRSRSALPTPGCSSRRRSSAARLGFSRRGRAGSGCRGRSLACPNS